MRTALAAWILAWAALSVGATWPPEAAAAPDKSTATAAKPHKASPTRAKARKSAVARTAKKRSGTVKHAAAPKRDARLALAPLDPWRESAETAVLAESLEASQPPESADAPISAGPRELARDAAHKGRKRSSPAGTPPAREPAPPEVRPEPASNLAVQFAAWVVSAGDNQRRPFIIVDKRQAAAFVFDAQGQLKGAAPVLIGSAAGDDSAPGVGDHSDLSAIPPAERTTPAGRFNAAFGPDDRGDKVLWVDYATAVSLHRVIRGDRGDRRLQRLSTPTPADNRITHGCINVPVAFYDKVVGPAFKGGKGVVYILPDSKAVSDVFPAFQLPDAPLQTAALSEDEDHAASEADTRSRAAETSAEQELEIFSTRPLTGLLPPLQELDRAEPAKPSKPQVKVSARKPASGRSARAVRKSGPRVHQSIPAPSRSAARSERPRPRDEASD